MRDLVCVTIWLVTPHPFLKILTSSSEWSTWFNITESSNIIWLKVKSGHRSKFSNLDHRKDEAWKISGLQRNSNSWPPRHRCDARPTELWSHTFGARSIVELISSRAVKWCEIFMKFILYCDCRYEFNKWYWSFHPTYWVVDMTLLYKLHQFAIIKWFIAWSRWVAAKEHQFICFFSTDSSFIKSTFSCILYF